MLQDFQSVSGHFGILFFKSLKGRLPWCVYSLHTQKFPNSEVSKKHNFLNESKEIGS